MVVDGDVHMVEYVERVPLIKLRLERERERERESEGGKGGEKGTWVYAFVKSDTEQGVLLLGLD